MIPQYITLFRRKNLAAGEWVDADDGATIDVDNLSTLSVAGTVPNCGSGETNCAISAISACFVTGCVPGYVMLVFSTCCH